MRKEKGFTLIELLVVIAIIGILSSVVLANLNTARTKGKDASIKSEMSSMRAQAELFNDTNGYYTGVCANTTTGIGQLKAVVAGTAGTAVTCNDATSTWASSVLLLSPTTATYFCVDSTGVATSASSTLGALTHC